MAYISSYMRPNYVNADNSAPSITGLQQYIQQGFDAGRAQGQNQQLAQLAQAAYNDTGDQQQQDVSKAIGISPQAGFALANTVGAPTAAQQQQMQLKRYGGVASAIFQAKQAGNDAGAEGLYQAVVPELAAMAAKSGGSPPPANLDAALADPKISSTMYQLAQMYGNGLPAATKGVVIAPGGQLINPTTGAQMASVPNKPQVVGGMLFNPATGTASQIPLSGAPAQSAPSAGLNTTVPGMNGQGVQFNFPPGTPPEVIAAAKASAVANGDIAPDTQVGAQAAQWQPQTLAGALASKGQVRTLSPAEVKAAGLPDGTVAQQSPDGKINVVSKPGGQAGAPMTFGDATKTGADYLSTLDPQIASQVKALDEGRMQFPSSFALKTPYWQGMLAAVSRYDPSFDAVNYNTRASTRKAFTSGKEAQQVNALNTVAQHLAQLQGYADKLGNSSFTPYNTAKNAIEGTLGNPAPTNFNRTVLPVAQELERVWRGTGGSEGDIKEWISNLSSSSSPAQFKDAFSGLTDLIYGKLSALRDQYVQGMGTTANPYRFLSPKTQQIFSHLDSIDAGKIANDATAGNNVSANAPQSSAPASSGVDALLSKYGVQ